MGARRFRKSFLLALALGISVLFFFFVIRRFLLTVLLAAVFAGLFVTVWHIYGEVFQDWLPEEQGRSDEDELRSA